ncbi:putative atp-dependent RNA helicase dhx35-like, partial [Globisporangium splendens]
MAFWRPGNALPDDAALRSGEAREAPKDVEVPGVLFNPLHRLPLSAQRQRLPVFAHRSEILFAVECYATTILVGATGSGKTTQVPQYLMEAGWATQGPRKRMIVCTQPRRIAAITIAERVAKEVGTPLGKEDEAHERNLETDLLLGLIKKIQRKRPELRVVIASATLQVDTFIRFFTSKKRKLQSQEPQNEQAYEELRNDVIAVSVEGRLYPVDVEYLKEPCGDYLQKTIDTVLSIDEREGEGDILVFLPGQEEIDFVVRALNDRAGAHLLPLPFYATLPLQMQQNVFLPPPSRSVRRKVIVATTIAETSVTIDGVVFVVDSCFVKLAYFNPFTGVESLITTCVSKASAKQRAGRAGRVRPGKCFRLCTQAHFKTSFAKETMPQMQRTNLAPVALHLLSMGICDLAHFEFVSPPSPEALIRALELLYSLGAIDDNCRLTEPLGTQIAEFPVEPMLAKVLLSSFQYGCTQEILSIASILSVGDIFLSARGSRERKERLVEAMGEFAHPDGDHMTYLHIYDEFLENGKKREWCDEHLLDYRALVRAVEIRKHLKKYVNRFKSASGDDQSEFANEDTPVVSILKCLVSGYFANAARMHADGMYRTVREKRLVQIHPTSVYYHMGKSPEWILFHQSVLTTDEYIRDIAKIDPRWLVEIAPEFYHTREVSSVLSGSSGTLGLPKSAPPAASKANGKAATPAGSVPATALDGRILFRKPASSSNKKEKSKLPVHIGKSKGGLRSQF